MTDTSSGKHGKGTKEGRGQEAESAVAKHDEDKKEGKDHVERGESKDHKTESASGEHDENKQEDKDNKRERESDKSAAKSEGELDKTCMCGAVSGTLIFVEDSFQKAGKEFDVHDGEHAGGDEQEEPNSVIFFVIGSVAGGVVAALLLLACCRWRSRINKPAKESVQSTPAVTSVVVGIPMQNDKDLELGTEHPNAL